MIYDCTRPETFKNIPMWNSEIPANIQYKALISNKIDLINERIVTELAGQKMGQKLMIPIYKETSVFQNINITQTFQEMLSILFLKTKETFNL